MQAFFETAFDAVYLVSVVVIGILMIKNANGSRQYTMFGIMAVTLGLGDSFHLIPRSYALITNGLEANAAALGIGKFITSITMTVFYVILYHIWYERYKISGRKGLTLSIYALAAVRIALCFFPQNEWTSHIPPVEWGIYRNIPFALMGIIIIILFAAEAKKRKDRAYRFMSLAIILSFGFYVPVVLWADTIPTIGILMIPKTLAYVWVVLMGYMEMRRLQGKVKAS